MAHLVVVKEKKSWKIMNVHPSEFQYTVVYAKYAPSYSSEFKPEVTVHSHLLCQKSKVACHQVIMTPQDFFLLDRVSCIPGWFQIYYIANTDLTPLIILAPEITGVPCHTWFVWFWVWNPGMMHTRQTLS